MVRRMKEKHERINKLIIVNSRERIVMVILMKINIMISNAKYNSCNHLNQWFSMIGISFLLCHSNY